MALKHSKTGLLLQNRNVRSNPAMDVLRNACKVNVPNIFKNILNVIIQFTPAPLDKATFYIRLL